MDIKPPESPGGTEVPSTLPSIGVSVRGFSNLEAAKNLGRSVLAALEEVGRAIDISTLDGVTVAVDYDEALAELDRGKRDLKNDWRTNDGVLTGVAKSTLVLRDGIVKTHLVFDAAPICPLALSDVPAEELRAILAIIAHECAHVEEHGRFDHYFPNYLLNKSIAGYVPALKQQFSESFWNEYAACRIASRWDFGQEKGLREGLSLRLSPSPEVVQNSIARYRFHGDVDLMFREVAYAALEPLRMASYLFGHLDGLEEINEEAIRAELSTESMILSRAIVQLVLQLRKLWASREHWSSPEDMLILGDTAFDLIRDFGVDVQHCPDGAAYINVP